jgi:hypothetical protein
MSTSFSEPHDQYLFDTADLSEQIACVERELAMRQRVYPRQVAAGKMTEAKAQHEIRVMQSVLETLRDLWRSQHD